MVLCGGRLFSFDSNVEASLRNMQETGLRDTIVSESGELFIQRGYNGVSIKQIAEASRCTTAALYYYFPEGKESILKDVLRSHLPDPEQILLVGLSANSLKELLTGVALKVCAHDSDVVKKERWLLAEFPNFTESDRKVIHETMRAIHTALEKEVSRFVTDRETSKMLSWIFMSASFGYGQLFGSLQIKKVADLPTQEFSEKIGAILSSFIDS
ncbi:TetR/AcrR family transcriptional regulator [Leptospira kmetyi]|uniref:TetR/AcrR family transcriptional regulator n=2 Tax=Leptospira kmetyi TaxID=408139 RepID=A0AAD0UPW6_9LEPT|nr:TetR/AcrR family transcriptional regulator [Leptospira kmetyi]PJZ43004.1 TetR/AcrR family transcriptional regulator [Leptospira kmetyi]